MTGRIKWVRVDLEQPSVALWVDEGEGVPGRVMLRTLSANRGDVDEIFRLALLMVKQWRPGDREEALGARAKASLARKSDDRRI